MIKLRNLTSRQTNLVSIRAESLRSLAADLNLRQLSLQCSAQRHCRIRCAGNTHRLVNPRTSGKRIAYSAANTSRSAAKRLNFSRMIMSFVLEHQKPSFFPIAGISILIMSVMNININRAGVIFLADFKVIKLSVLFKIFYADNSHIHKADRLIRTSGIHFSSHLRIILQRLLEQIRIRAVLNLNIFQLGQERRVAAMVRPVSIQNTNFSFCRVAFFTGKVTLQKFNIRKIHRKAHLLAVIFQSLVIPANKTINNRNIIRNLRHHLQSFRNRLVICQTAVNRINQITLDFFHIISRNLSAQNNHFSTTNAGSLRQNLNRRSHSGPKQIQTLFRAVRPLIILTRQIFPNNNSITVSNINPVIKNKITLRFAKNSSSSSLPNSLADIFNIIAVKITNSSHTRNSQKIINLRQITFSLVSKTRLPFYI